MTFYDSKGGSRDEGGAVLPNVYTVRLETPAGTEYDVATPGGVYVWRHESMVTLYPTEGDMETGRIVPLARVVSMRFGVES